MLSHFHGHKGEEAQTGKFERNKLKAEQGLVFVDKVCLLYYGRCNLAEIQLQKLNLLIAVLLQWFHQGTEEKAPNK